MSCKKCKRICKLCEHFLDDSSIPKCNAAKFEKMDCVTGDIEIIYPPCSEINKDGCCEKYKEDKVKKLRRDLLKLLNQYANEIVRPKYNSSGSTHIEDVLVENLIKFLNARETDFYEYYDSNYGSINVGYKYIEKEYTEHYKKWKEKRKKESWQEEF